MTIATNVFAVIGVFVVACWLVVLVILLAARRSRQSNPGLAAAMARHPAGGRQPHLHLVSGDAA